MLSVSAASPPWKADAILGLARADHGPKGPAVGAEISKSLGQLQIRLVILIRTRAGRDISVLERWEGIHSSEVQVLYVA